MEHSRLTPNYYFASTETGVEQMAKAAEFGIWFDTDIKSSVAGQFNPLFKNFTQSDKMNITARLIKWRMALHWHSTRVGISIIRKTVLLSLVV